MGKESKRNWTPFEKMFRLGQFSATEIARQMGCSTSTVTRHMAENGIVRDKAEEVKRKTRDAITVQRCSEPSEADISDAVQANVALVLSHRRDLLRLKEIEEKLLTEVKGNPTKLYLATFQGQVVEKVVGLTALEKSTTLLNLSRVQAHRIDKQRQAFNLDTPTTPDPLENMSREELERRIAELEKRR